MTDLRRQNQLKVVAGIESYTKRNAIRHVKDTAGFEKDEISIVYDKFFGALYYSKQEKSTDGTHMDFNTFLEMLNSITTWSKLKQHDDTSNESYMRTLGVRFLQRLYEYFKEGHQGVTFQDAVLGLSEIMHGVCSSICFILLYKKKLTLI